jgi:hypothetical protein
MITIDLRIRTDGLRTNPNDDHINPTIDGNLVHKILYDGPDPQTFLKEYNTTPDGPTLFKNMIEAAFIKAQNKNDNRGRQAGLNTRDQRKIARILDKLDATTTTVDLDDDHFDFLKRTFYGIEDWVGGAKIIDRVCEKLDEAEHKTNPKEASTKPANRLP